MCAGKCVTIESRTSSTAHYTGTTIFFFSMALIATHCRFGDAACGNLNLTIMALVEELKTKAATYNPTKREGKVAKAIEEQTAKLPSDAFLWTAVGCMAASLVFQLTRRDHLSLFIGQWVPSFLLFGIYNKIVKVEGHDSEQKNQSLAMG
jgi:hypothetical protein